MESNDESLSRTNESAESAAKANESAAKADESITKATFATVESMAKAWNVSQQTVRAWCRKGEIPGAELHGGQWIIPMSRPPAPEPAMPTSPSLGLALPARAEPVRAAPRDDRLDSFWILMAWSIVPIWLCAIAGFVWVILLHR